MAVEVDELPRVISLVRKVWLTFWKQSPSSRIPISFRIRLVLPIWEGP